MTGFPNGTGRGHHLGRGRRQCSWPTSTASPGRLGSDVGDVEQGLAGQWRVDAVTHGGDGNRGAGETAEDAGWVERVRRRNRPLPGSRAERKGRPARATVGPAAAEKYGGPTDKA